MKSGVPAAAPASKRRSTAERRVIRANSVPRALARIGDRWSLLILAAAFQGAERFEDWRRGIGIATNVLTMRLNRLVANGCLVKVPTGAGLRRRAYRLTPMGMEIYPTALMFWRFDRLWSKRRRLQPPSLTHALCSSTMMPVLICAECREPVHAREVRYQDGPGAGRDRMLPPRASRRSNVKLGDGAQLEMLMGDSIDYFGDRWTQQVLAAFFLGAHRYEEIRLETRIATNILADRLKLLTEQGMIERRVYQTNPSRYEYALTPKGMDIYPIILTLTKWGDRWLAGRAGPPLLLYHKRCGKRLDPIVVCDHCGVELDRNEVRFRR